MRQSPQQSPSGSVSSCSSPTPLHSTWNQNTGIDRTTPISTTTISNRSHIDSHSNNNNDEYVDDDIFGSAAWRKQRGTKRGAKTASGQENGRRGSGGDNKKAATQNDGAGSGDWHRRAVLVRVLEKGAQVLKTRMVVIGSWVGTLWVWMSQSLSSSSPSTTKEPASAAAAALVDVPGEAQAAAMPGCPRAAWTAKTAVPEPDSYELTTEVIVQQARLLCGNYIYHRLCSKGLMSKRVHVAPYHSLVSEELCSAGQELERLHPKVYSDVSRRIAMTMSSAQLVRRLLTSVLEGTFKAGITWAKVVSMVVISAAFAEECVVQGHPNFVEDVVMCVGHFVMVHLTGWLVKQGGWAAFPTSRPPVLEKPSDSSPALLHTVLVLFGLAILVLGLLKLLLSIST